MVTLVENLSDVAVAGNSDPTSRSSRIVFELSQEVKKQCNICESLENEKTDRISHLETVLQDWLKVFEDPLVKQELKVLLPDISYVTPQALLSAIRVNNDIVKAKEEEIGDVSTFNKDKLRNSCLQYENKIDKMKIEEEITKHHLELMYSEKLQKQKEIFQSKLEQLVLENQALQNEVDNLRNRLNL